MSPAPIVFDDGLVGLLKAQGRRRRPSPEEAERVMRTVRDCFRTGFRRKFADPGSS
jgi:hypothetical protein